MSSQCIFRDMIFDFNTNCPWNEAKLDIVKKWRGKLKHIRHALKACHPASNGKIARISYVPRVRQQKSYGTYRRWNKERLSRIRNRVEGEA